MCRTTLSVHFSNIAVEMSNICNHKVLKSTILDIKHIRDSWWVWECRTMQQCKTKVTNSFFDVREPKEQRKSTFRLWNFVYSHRKTSKKSKNGRVCWDHVVYSSDERQLTSTVLLGNVWVQLFVTEELCSKKLQAGPKVLRRLGFEPVRRDISGETTETSAWEAGSVVREHAFPFQNFVQKADRNKPRYFCW